MVQEPTAAAVWYAFDMYKQNKKLPESVLVFDFGGGTLDISIIQVSNGEFTVRAFDGDYFLGGQDIDIEVMKFIIEEFKENTGIDLSTGNDAKTKRARAKIKKEA